ncbi:MAG: hypothetical protein ACJA1B_002171 [Polaribacter sp.]|jgi:hypothetical protein
MSFWRILKNLNATYIIGMLSLLIKHPLFAIATVYGSLVAYRITQNQFPKIHSGENKANAFRHAIWNILIAKKCTLFSKNEKTILSWTKKVTDLHEELAPNQFLSKKMDLKNNEIGRQWFLNLRAKSLKEIKDFLLGKLDDAIRINETSKIEEINNLVFLEG